MSKFMNVVRSKIKQDKKDEYIKKLREFFDNMKGTEGLISMKQIQTGSNNMCIVGEWKDEQSIAKARNKIMSHTYFVIFINNTRTFRLRSIRTN